MPTTKPRLRRAIWLTAALAAYFAVAYTLLDHFGITCVFLELFGIPCPGCGMTRALVSLVRLDFYQAAKHNVIIFFIPYVFAFVLFDFQHRRHITFLKVIAAVAIINWILKIILIK